MTGQTTPPPPHTPNLPAWIVADDDNLLLKGFWFALLLRPEPQEVNHSVILFVAPTNTMYSDAA